MKLPLQSRLSVTYYEWWCELLLIVYLLLKITLALKLKQGASINYVDQQQGRRRCHPNVNDTTYLSLCSNLVNEGASGISKILEILSTQFMDAPILVRTFMQCYMVVRSFFIILPPVMKTPMICRYTKFFHVL